ncbi:MAG: hypothetical protein AB7I04_05385 [Pseudomonadales bacterium]
MRERIVSWLYFLLVGLLLALFLAGCTEGADTSTAGQPMPTAGGSPQGAALYGVNVAISYPGSQALEKAAMVYVFLRKPGTRMPLAVQHFAAAELPKTVSFAGTGQDEAVELVVRLSPSGRVDRSAGDVEFSRMLPGLLHPPQTVQVALGAADPASATTEVAAGAAAGNAVGNDDPTATVPVALRATVRLAEGSRFAPESVVFIIARQPGQAMPAAVKRLSVADLPAEVELSDADAMSFGNRLSAAPVLEISARVSLSGTASRSEEDWASETVRVEPRGSTGMIALTLQPPRGT